MSISAELYEFIVKVVEDKIKDIKVTREEFDKLTNSVKELTEKTKELAEAQKKTEDRLNKLAERINELAEAQKRTEERLNALAEAQAKTEERLNALAEAQKRTEERLNELAEAQRRTEERLNLLVKAIGELRREVGRLSETVGFGLEDIARVVLPGWLYRHLGIEIEGLERRYFIVDGREVEVNLYGEGRRNGERIIVIGECKSRIYGRDVESFYEKYKLLKEKLDDKTIGLLFGYLIHPSAEEKARELGLYVIASYHR